MFGARARESVRIRFSVLSAGKRRVGGAMSVRSVGAVEMQLTARCSSDSIRGETHSLASTQRESQRNGDPYSKSWQYILLGRTSCRPIEPRNLFASRLRSAPRELKSKACPQTRPQHSPTILYARTLAHSRAYLCLSAVSG